MAEGKGAYTAALTATTATTGGAVLSLANPEGADLIITRLLLDVTTGSTGAANLTGGVAAAATTANDGLITATAAGSGAVLMDSANTTGRAQKWGANQFLNVTGSGSTAGMVGKAYVQYVRAEA